MPRIVFIEPQAPNLHIFSQFPLPRLGTLILGTMMKRRGWEVEVFVEDLRRVDYALLAGSEPSIYVIALTALVWLGVSAEYLEEDRLPMTPQAWISMPSWMP